jgi:hypothetical protein
MLAIEEERPASIHFHRFAAQIASSSTGRFCFAARVWIWLGSVLWQDVKLLRLIETLAQSKQNSVSREIRDYDRCGSHLDDCANSASLTPTNSLGTGSIPFYATNQA